MIIQKTYKFYAAHRNEELQDKCRNLHGHRYGIRCYFRVKRKGAISTLFGDFDERIEPFLKREYDHAMLINVNDGLYDALCDYMQRSGDALKLKRFDAPTSVENVAHQLFSEISAMGFNLERLAVQETDTSTVVYTRRDWRSHNRHVRAGDREGSQGVLV
jgi:6-pyruvoyltetrahydropterin/6-carboxytetrahydropterin synthase